MFYGTNSIKRHVVGRGVLTERDRAILMREETNARETVAPTPEHGTEITAGDTDKNGLQAVNDDDQHQGTFIHSTTVKFSFTLGGVNAAVLGPTIMVSLES